MRIRHTLPLRSEAAGRPWIAWAALFALPLVLYPAVLSSSWTSNSDVHALLEFCAAAIALVAAGVVLIHFFATGRRFFLLISLGFTLQGAEDLVHAALSFSRIWGADWVGIQEFVPGTYVAGRLILLRDMGRMSFAHLRDESGQIQIALRKNAVDETGWALTKLLDLGDIVAAAGAL